MGPLAHAFRPSGLTLGRPPCSFLPSLGDVIPMVPILVSGPECLASELGSYQPDLPASVKLLSTLFDLE
jgi:hypothetical protein